MPKLGHHHVIRELSGSEFDSVHRASEQLLLHGMNSCFCMG